MFNELHFVPVKGPTNVYSLAVVDVLGDPLVLVATRTGSVVRVALWDFSWGKEETVPFLYVPGDAEIVAIDAYCTDAQGIVVAITFMKTVGECQSFLNIYGLTTTDDDKYNLNVVAADCLVVLLAFQPLKLMHITSPDEIYPVFIISGSDGQIYAFRDSEQIAVESILPLPRSATNDTADDDTTHKSNNTDVHTAQETHSVTTALDIWTHSTHALERTVLVCGSSDGLVTLYSPHSLSESLCSVRFDGPISDVHLFTRNTDRTGPLLLAVACALDDDCVYEDILRVGLSVSSSLSHTTKPKGQQTPNDCTLSILSCDVTFDRHSELITAHYSQSVCIHQSTVSAHTDTLQWQLMHTLDFAMPLYALSYVDMTGDGLNELLVLSLNGVHILQHDLETVRAKVLERLSESDVSS